MKIAFVFVLLAAIFALGISAAPAVPKRAEPTPTSDVVAISAAAKRDEGRLLLLARAIADELDAHEVSRLISGSPL